MEAPLYDLCMTPFKAIEGEVILEVALEVEEGLVTPKGWEGENDFFLNLLVHAGNSQWVIRS